MASSVSGDQSLSLSLSSGRTITRLSSDSPEEQRAMAMPSIIMADSGERIALTDGDTVEASEDASTPMIIVDVAMKSLSSSLADYGVMGATGSSDSRGKSRSPPRAISDRPEKEFSEYSTFAGISKERNQSCSDSATKEHTPVSGCGYPCN